MHQVSQIFFGVLGLLFCGFDCGIGNVDPKKKNRRSLRRGDSSGMRL